MWLARCGIPLIAIGSLAHAQSAWDPDAKPALTPQLTQSALQRGLNPPLYKAAGGADHAGCLLRVWYNARGTILVEQILKSSGHPEIDQACLATAIGQPLKAPALLDPNDGGWTQFPIVWDFVTRKAIDKAPPMEADPAIPALREGNAMHVAPPYYPEAALAARAHGICKLHSPSRMPETWTLWTSLNRRARWSWIRRAWTRSTTRRSYPGAGRVNS